MEDAPSMVPMAPTSTAAVDQLARWVFLFFIIYSLVLAFVFVLHYFDRASREEGEVLPLRTYLRIFAQEWWFSLAAMLLYPFGLLPRLTELTFDPNGGPPIVLLHGYGMNRSCWFAVYWRLRRVGFHNLYALNLRPRLGSIEATGASLRERLYEIAELSGGQPVQIIAHSMAGIVSRWCIADDPDLPVANLITIASPHHGTRTAVLGPGKNAAQLRPGSELLTRLNAEPAQRLVSIYSELDSLVIPSDSSRFGPLVVPCQDGGHVSLLFSARTFERVLEHLPTPGEGEKS